MKYVRLQLSNNFPKLSFGTRSNNFLDFIFTYAVSTVIFPTINGALTFIPSLQNTKHITFHLPVPWLTQVSQSGEVQKLLPVWWILLYFFIWTATKYQILLVFFPYVSFLADKNTLHRMAVQHLVDFSATAVRSSLIRN